MKKRGEAVEKIVQEETVQEDIVREDAAQEKHAKKPKKKKAKKEKTKKPEKGKRKEKSSSKKSNNKAVPSFKKVVPYADYDDEHDVIVNKDDTAFDYIKIKTKDLMNAGTDELERDRIALTRAYRLMKGSIKIISLNFPCNTTEQEQYIQNRIDHARDPRFIPWLKAKQYELKFLQDNTSEREYYIMVNGESAEECAKTRDLLLNALIDLAEPCTKTRKIKLIEKINNPNSFISA